MITLDLREAKQAAMAQAKAEQDRQQRLSAKREYASAQVNRLTSDWTITSTSTRSELRIHLRNLRARSRDLARNNDYIKKFLSMVQGNVIGPKGITLQVRAQSDDEFSVLDDELNRTVEADWAKWGHAETCSASGKLSWLDCQRLFMRTLGRDGEVLVRKLFDQKHPFGFKLKFIDVNWLDEQYNDRLANGNRVLMSIEVDEDERVVAYYLTPPTDEFTYPGATWDKSISGRSRTRVPASEMIHAFLIEDENQTRGIPWSYTAMQRLKILNGYEEAELVAARVAACKGGFLKPPEDQPFEGEEQTQVTEQVEPGMLQQLPAGWSFEAFDPTHPNNNYSGFIKAALRGIASGLEVAYTSLANDLEGVNYSSIRSGLLEERDVWRGLQAWTIEHFCRPVYQAWLEAAWLSGALEISMKQLERVKEPSWQPRGWAWVDPLKDIQATILAINNGLETRSDALAEQGKDFADVVQSLAKEQKLLEAAGVQLVAQEIKPAPDPAEK